MKKETKKSLMRQFGGYSWLLDIFCLLLGVGIILQYYHKTYLQNLNLFIFTSIFFLILLVGVIVSYSIKSHIDYRLDKIEQQIQNTR